MVSKANANAQQVLQSGGGLSQVKSASGRYQLAKDGMNNLAGELSKTIQSFNDLVAKAGHSPEVTSICESFQSQQESLQKVVTEASSILQKAKENDGKLSTDDAQRLEELNQKANTIKDSITDLIKQLRFKDRDNDRDDAGSSAFGVLVSATA